MDRIEFQARFKAYSGNFGFFSDTEWQTMIKKWKEEYYDLIVSPDGLPFEKWIQNTDAVPSDGYLPSFLEHCETKFGSARPQGSAEGYMVYKTYDTAKHGNKQYYNKYNPVKNDRYSDTDKDARSSYEANIKPLLKNICNCKNLNDVYQVASSVLYKKYHSSQLLQKIFVLNHSLFFSFFCPSSKFFIHFFVKIIIFP